MATGIASVLGAFNFIVALKVFNCSDGDSTKRTGLDRPAVEVMMQRGKYNIYTFVLLLL